MAEQYNILKQNTGNLTHWLPYRPNHPWWAFFPNFDIITFDQNWHHLYSTSAGGKDLSNETQIRVIGSVEPEICTEMLKNLSEKLRAKFPATAHGYSMVKFALSRRGFLRSFFNCKQAQ